MPVPPTNPDNMRARRRWNPLSAARGLLRPAPAATDSLRPTPFSSRSTAWRATGHGASTSVASLPLLAIVLLVAMSAGLAYLLIDEDSALRRDALHRDTDTLAQSMSLRLQAIGETTSALARDAASPDADGATAAGRCA